MTFNPNEYWEARLTKRTNIEGVGYLKLGIAFNNWTYRVRKFAFKKQIHDLKLNPAEWNVIDLGSGIGFYISLWKELKAKSITGADLTEVAYKELKIKFPENNFYRIDLGENLPDYFPKGFDAVSCMDVLFHIVDDTRFEKAVSNIASILKPGGYFFYSDIFMHDKEIRAEWQVVHTLDYLENLFRKNGFEIIRRRPFMYLTNPPVDSKNPILKTSWWVMERAIKFFKPLGEIIGTLLYPLEIVLVATTKEGPSSEIMVLRKV